MNALREKVGQSGTNISPFPLIILKYDFCSNTTAFAFQGRRDEEANLFWKKSNFLSIAKAALHALTPFVTHEFRIQIYLHL